MGHMVIYRGADGETGYHEVEEVADAIAWVERLRNDQGVESARIYRLEEVAFQFRPYFRVELDGSETLDLRDGAGDVAGAGGPGGEHGDGSDLPAPVGSDGHGGARRGLFGR